VDQPPVIFSSSAAMLGLSVGLEGAEKELHKMLIDERMKSETHKTNYQTLKAEHTSLQDEFVRAQTELKRLLSDRQSLQEKTQLLQAELRGQLLDKSRELDQLRLKVMTPERLELLRAQVQQEMEAPVRERFNKLEEEAEKYRSEYNKLRYDYTFLQSQWEQQREEHGRMLEERRICYEAEIARLEKDREELMAQRRDSDRLQDGQRVEALLREKAQLHLRMKGLEAELAELRALKENSGQQAESVQRIQTRQLTESQAAVKSLEAERQSLRLQLERTEGELHQSLEQSDQLTARLHKAEREVSALSCQMESLKHSHKLEVDRIRLECARSKAELERERDTLQGQNDGLQTDVEVLKAAVSRSKEVLMEKERDAVRRVQSAREEEQRRTAALHEEKLELENRLSTLEQQRALQDASEQALREEWEERVHSAQQGEELARRELQNLRMKLQQQSLQLEEQERRRAELSDLQQVTTHTCAHTEVHTFMHTTNTQKHMHVGTAAPGGRGLRLRRCHSATLIGSRAEEDRRVEWLEEKHKLQEREAGLQQKYSQLKEKLQRAAVAQKKVTTPPFPPGALEAERPALSEEHAQLHRRLRELQRRHNEFRRLLLGSQGVFGGGPALLTSSAAAAAPLLLSERLPSNDPVSSSKDC
uniref:Centrosomal protein 83 n=1 Tax=Oryzias sinensis TaxID=183150 RepID=A0A8C7XJP8_9TELE